MPADPREEDRAARFRADTPEQDAERHELSGVPARSGRRFRPRKQREGELLRATLRVPLSPSVPVLALVTEVSPTGGTRRDGIAVRSFVDGEPSDKFRRSNAIALDDRQARFLLAVGPLVVQRGAPRPSCNCEGGSLRPNANDRRDTCGLCGGRRQVAL